MAKLAMAIALFATMASACSHPCPPVTPTSGDDAPSPVAVSDIDGSKVDVEHHDGVFNGQSIHYVTAGPADGKKVLEQIASETGGRFYQVSHSHPLDKIFADIQEDLRNQYNIGYTPDQASEPGLFRHIHLAAKKKDLVVQSRTGYYSS